MKKILYSMPQLFQVKINWTNSERERKRDEEGKFLKIKFNKKRSKQTRQTNVSPDTAKCPWWVGGKGQNNYPRLETTELSLKILQHLVMTKVSCLLLRQTDAALYIHHRDPRLLPAHGSLTPRPRSLTGSFHMHLDNEPKDRVGRAVGEISGASPGNLTLLWPSGHWPCVTTKGKCEQAANPGGDPR